MQLEIRILQEKAFMENDLIKMHAYRMSKILFNWIIKFEFYIYYWTIHYMVRNHPKHNKPKEKIISIIWLNIDNKDRITS